MVKADRELYEPPYDDALMYDTVEEPQGPRGRPLIVLLGFVVLAAFAAVVWVAYQQGVKEGQRSNPPILSAESGPTRITPDAQQTASTPATDKSIDRLPGEAEASTGDEQLMPAPEEPRPLPSPQEVTAATAPPAVSMIAPPSATAAVPPAEGRPDSNHPGLDTTVSPVTPALPAGGQSLFSTQTTHSPSSSEDLTPALPSEGVAPTAITPAPAPKPAKPKPAAVPALPAAPPVSEAATVPSGEGGPFEPTTSAPPVASGGPIAIQLGSFPSDMLAAQSWGKIKQANVAVLGEYSPAFQRAVVTGKGTWYRLQVTGFADKAAAADVCNKLKANGQACIITTAK